VLKAYAMPLLGDKIEIPSREAITLYYFFTVDVLCHFGHTV